MEMENENKTEEKNSSAENKEMKNNNYIGKIKTIWGKNKKTIIAIVILVILVAGSLAFKAYWKTVDVGPDVVKEKIQTFIKNNAPTGTQADIKSIAKEGDLYKVTLSISGQDVPLYVTRDGKKLIQQPLDLDQTPNTQSANTQAPPAKTVADQKTAVPDVKLFVMSFCPYGTQIEKGILPVVDLLKNKINFSLEFVDYSMHGDNEIDENLRQYCIEKTQQPKFSAYLKCYLKVGQGTSDACMKTASIASASINTCMTQTDAQFSIKANAADKSKWNGGPYPPFDINKDDNAKYSVQGSPTLVINGTTVSSSLRDSASLLKEVCSGFTTQPKECSQTLSSTAPAPGFGEGSAAAGTAAGAACATPQQ